MTTAAVLGEDLADLQEFFPCPNLIVLETRWCDSSLVKHFGIVVEVMGHPSGADAVPAPVDLTAIGLLRLNEIIRLPQKGIVLDQVGNIHQSAAYSQSLVVVGQNKAGVRRSASGEARKQNAPVFARIRCMLPLDGDIWVLFHEDFDSCPHPLIFGDAAPAAKGDIGDILRQDRRQIAKLRQHSRRRC